MHNDTPPFWLWIVRDGRKRLELIREKGICLTLALCFASDFIHSGICRCYSYTCIYRVPILLSIVSDRVLIRWTSYFSIERAI